MDVVGFDPFGGSFLEDPYPHFAPHVRHQPVFYAEDLDYWVVSRYDDCRRALREFATFSASNALAPMTMPCPAARAALPDGGFRSIPTITNVDPPAHTRTRRIAQALARLQPGLRLADDDQRMEFTPIIAFRGPTSLWVEA